MNRTILKELGLTLLLIALGCVPVFAQESALPNELSEAVIPYDDPSAPDGLEVIFSNLDSSPAGRYNSDPFDAWPVAGKDAGGGQTEQLVAIQFVPETDVQAKILSAAIGYISGTKLVKLGIYNSNGGTVGSPLPGGQGSTSQIPDVGQCCQMTTVILPGEGVTLTGGTAFWLLAGPDKVNGADFSGGWQLSNSGASAYLAPPFPWHPLPGYWPAAQIRGSRLQAPGIAISGKLESFCQEMSTPASKVTIFTNLNTATDAYDPTHGGYVTGKNVISVPDVTQALPFTPRANVHAKSLAAAIGRVAGTSKVNLGIYSDNGGIPGSLLPGGQGSTTDIPDSGTCCELAKVTLAGAGVALQANVQYWLIASADNVEAPDFDGVWRFTSQDVGAYKQPELLIGWYNFSPGWFAAEIRGTIP